MFIITLQPRHSFYTCPSAHLTANLVSFDSWLRSCRLLFLQGGRSTGSPCPPSAPHLFSLGSSIFSARSKLFCLWNHPGCSLLLCFPFLTLSSKFVSSSLSKVLAPLAFTFWLHCPSASSLLFVSLEVLIQLFSWLASLCSAFESPCFFRTYYPIACILSFPILPSFRSIIIFVTFLVLL